MSKRLAMLDDNGFVINVAMFADDVEPDGVTTAVPHKNTRVGDKVVGGILLDIPDPAVVPEEVSKLQLVRALRAAGHWGSVKSALAQADTTTKEDWDYAYQINRDDPLMETFAGALGLTPADMDELFVNGATL